MTIQDDFAKQAQEMFAAAKDAKIPENLQHDGTPTDSFARAGSRIRCRLPLRW